MRNTTTSAGPARRNRHSGRAYHDRYIDVQGVHARLIEAGQEHAGVPLLLIHGYNASSDYWTPFTIPALSTERHVLAVDLPGCGLSSGLPVQSLDSLTRFVIDLIDALGLPSVDLMGHAMGGMLVIGVAVVAPERVRRLLLVDSAGLPELVTNQWSALLRMARDASVRQVRLYPMFVKIGLRPRPPRQTLDRLRAESVGPLLARIKAPTLILWGSRDRVIPLEHGAHLAQRIDGARLVIMRGAGHMPFTEKPHEFNRLVLGFLRD